MGEEIIMGSADGVVGEFLVGQFDSGVHDGDSDARALGEGPSGADIEIGAVLGACAGAIFQGPLLGGESEVSRVMEVGAERGGFTATNGAGGEDFRQGRKACGFAGGDPGVGGLEDENIGGDLAREREGGVGGQTLEVGGIFELEDDAGTELNGGVGVIATPSLEPFGAA